MTDVVVTEAHNTVVINTQNQPTVVTVDQAPRTIVTGMMGPPGSAKLTDANDVDTSALTSGSLLVYNSASARWVASTLLNQQYVDCGEF